jgi:hypothetical protein
MRAAREAALRLQAQSLSDSSDSKTAGRRFTPLNFPQQSFTHHLRQAIWIYRARGGQVIIVTEEKSEWTSVIEVDDEVES